MQCRWMLIMWWVQTVLLVFLCNCSFLRIQDIYHKHGWPVMYHKTHHFSRLLHIVCAGNPIYRQNLHNLQCIPIHQLLWKYRLRNLRFDSLYRLELLTKGQHCNECIRYRLCIHNSRSLQENRVRRYVHQCIRLF